MPSPQEERKYYLRAPTLDNVLGGPIKIGNIISDMFSPDTPITYLDLSSRIIQGAGADAGKIERERHASMDMNFFMRLYELFGGRAEAKRDRTLRTIYKYDELESWHLSENPTLEEIETLRKTNAQVEGALNQGPIFVVTGLKVAKGLKYSNRQTAESGGELFGETTAVQNATMGGGAKGSVGEKDTEEYGVIGNCILAYRLQMIAKEGFFWQKERAVKTSAHDPAAAGFMDREKVKSSGLETGEVLRSDVECFADEQEYGGVQSLDVQNEDGWTMLYTASARS